MIQVTVMGIAQDGGHPQAGCERVCCKHAWDEGGHCVSSLAVISDTAVWLLDASPDLPRQLHLAKKPLAGIVLTHAHAGHYTGLWYLGREAMDTKRMPVYAMPKMKAFLSENQPFQALSDNHNIEYVDLVAAQSQRLSSEVQVVPHLVEHRGPWSETIGIEVKTATKKLLYVPDIDHFRGAPLEQWLIDFDHVLVDGTFFSADELARDIGEIPHPLVTTTMALLEHTPLSLRKKLCFIHLNHSNPLLDPRSPESERVAQWGATVAREGMSFSL